ncbi:hypothetical protein SAOR_08320 [Salinisphaera orenii MK-B5]|uniref:Uncharacterized protein n=1 Tax=Salinisphaera orenii MK-B5 TaxID=856730 RepID=A0A423PQS8_9GAMM|nr:hypothetical protein SAOR_08320 [Salinisphaera orenii MK-B5]
MSPKRKNVWLAIVLGGIAVGVYVAFFFEMAAR